MEDSDCYNTVAKTLDVSPYYAVVMLFNQDTGMSNHTDTLTTLKRVYLRPWAGHGGWSNLAVHAHELGHAFGLQHSTHDADNSPYHNAYDAMSAFDESSQSFWYRTISAGTTVSTLITAISVGFLSSVRTPSACTRTRTARSRSPSSTARTRSCASAGWTRVRPTRLRSVAAAKPTTCSDAQYNNDATSAAEELGDDRRMAVLGTGQSYASPEGIHVSVFSTDMSQSRFRRRITARVSTIRPPDSCR